MKSVRPTASKKKSTKPIVGSKKKSGAQPMMVDPAVMACRKKLYLAYETACQNQTSQCAPGSALLAAVQKCQIHGVGMPGWNMNDILTPEKIAELKALGYNPNKGRRCMTSAFWNQYGEELKACDLLAPPKQPQGQVGQMGQVQRRPSQGGIMPLKLTPLKPPSIRVPASRSGAGRMQQAQAIPFFMPAASRRKSASAA